MIAHTLYCVAVRIGRSTRCFYGERLKDATDAARRGLLQDGLYLQGEFLYAKFVRGREWSSEITLDGKMLASQPLIRRGRHARSAVA